MYLIRNASEIGGQTLAMWMVMLWVVPVGSMVVVGLRRSWRQRQPVVADNSPEVWSALAGMVVLSALLYKPLTTVADTLPVRWGFTASLWIGVLTPLLGFAAGRLAWRIFGNDTHQRR